MQIDVTTEPGCKPVGTDDPSFIPHRAPSGAIESDRHTAIVGCHWWLVHQCLLALQSPRWGSEDNFNPPTTGLHPWLPSIAARRLAESLQKAKNRLADDPKNVNLFFSSCPGSAWARGWNRRPASDNAFSHLWTSYQCTLRGGASRQVRSQAEPGNEETSV